MSGMSLRQNKEISNIEREDAATMSRCAKKLALITGIPGHPIIRCAA